jgi:hypothetical protein
LTRLGSSCWDGRHGRSSFSEGVVPGTSSRCKAPRTTCGHRVGHMPDLYTLIYLQETCHRVRMQARKLLHACMLCFRPHICRCSYLGRTAKTRRRNSSCTCTSCAGCRRRAARCAPWCAREPCMYRRGTELPRVCRGPSGRPSAAVWAEPVRRAYEPTPSAILKVCPGAAPVRRRELGVLTLEFAEVVCILREP